MLYGRQANFEGIDTVALAHSITQFVY